MQIIKRWDYYARVFLCLLLGPYYSWRTVEEVTRKYKQSGPCTS